MLRGERVLLRPVTPEDYPRLYAWRVDPAIWPLLTPAPLWPWTYADFCDYYDRLTRREGSAEFAVEVAGELVGRCGLFQVDELSRNAEIGISLGPEHRGKGYGRDVVRTLLAYAFTHRNLHRVWLEALVSNVAAVRAYAAAGFVEEGRLREHAWVEGRYEDMVRMAVLRSEWEAAR
jgi:RimJ/RimL family protein N-acetyltransferase